MEIVSFVLLLVSAALVAIGGGWLVFKALTTKTTLLWKATGLSGGLALLCLVASNAFTFASGCGAEIGCGDPWFVDLVRTIGLIGFASAVVLLFASAVEQHVRTWRRS